MLRVYASAGIGEESERRIFYRDMSQSSKFSVAVGIPDLLFFAGCNSSKRFGFRLFCSAMKDCLFRFANFPKTKGSYCSPDEMRGNHYGSTRRGVLSRKWQYSERRDPSNVAYYPNRNAIRGTFRGTRSSTHQRQHRSCSASVTEVTRGRCCWQSAV
jgi:hypothetical protein